MSIEAYAGALIGGAAGGAVFAVTGCSFLASGVTGAVTTMWSQGFDK